MVFRALLLISVFTAIASVNGNTEGDVLVDWKTKLNDPKGLLNSWDPTLVDPCTWFHVTCNDDNSVVRLDLGRAELSGELSPQLAQLTKLQYFAVFNNNLTGVIPPEFGDLTELLSLDLEYNKFSGSIPSSLGNLKSLRFLRLNSNKLTGELPAGIIELKNSGSLQVLNVSDNLLTGLISSKRLKGLAIRTNIQDPKRS